MIKLKIMRIANYFNFEMYHQKQHIWSFYVIDEHDIKLFCDSAMKLKRIYKWNYFLNYQKTNIIDKVGLNFQQIISMFFMMKETWAEYILSKNFHSILMKGSLDGFTKIKKLTWLQTQNTTAPM